MTPTTATFKAAFVTGLVGPLAWGAGPAGVLVSAAWAVRDRSPIGVVTRPAAWLTGMVAGAVTVTGLAAGAAVEDWTRERLRAARGRR